MSVVTLEPITPSPAPAGGAVGSRTPVRTCVGCRRTGTRDELVRHVLVDGVVTRDGRKALPGRGAWLHDDPACMTRAEKRRAFRRAFRQQG